MLTFILGHMNYIAHELDCGFVASSDVFCGI
jgi:hypothetical protein